ncbi:DUF6090 family protein [Maribacter sp. 1_2014MBL_MicDiv]|uniref:DUF6090 family protein n=1 Tax=Maribacter sp. 1_2014MBL_MicDiv TaxID=1644130 RepID=UPI0008F4AB9F|nr:DUF6090 family protein [Maribacter sp. 1_2014MBL_MicDiv]APA64425.1 hypothetical protein YQ22_08890 [Maribacter sp. 1_2014MBL_MicDiv]
MIKFFRKIRQNLLSESKFSKYLIYAIGEIILVVIGILIALQINNWNEKQKEEKSELLILKTLQKDFIENKKMYSEIVDKQQFVIDNCKSLIKCFENKDVEYKRDSIGTFIYYGAFNYYRAEPILGSYEALIGSGDLKILTNETLKSKLALFSSEINQGFEDEISAMNLLNTLNDEFSSIGTLFLDHKLRQSMGLGKLKENIEIKDKTISDLYQNSKILHSLAMKTGAELNRLKLHIKMLDYSTEILNLIESELQEKE